MMTKAIPGAGGIAWKKFSNARRPPADAPMPTTGNRAALFSVSIANSVAPFSRENHETYSKVMQARRFGNAANGH